MIKNLLNETKVNVNFLIHSKVYIINFDTCILSIDSVLLVPIKSNLTQFIT